MSREIEIERTARILKQADPVSIPPRPPVSDGSPATMIALLAAVVAFISVLIALAR